MIEPIETGNCSKTKRKAAGIAQDDIAAAIKKTDQYICSIEKGKNDALPNSIDIEKLIYVLHLDEVDVKECRRLASENRNQRSIKKKAHVLECKILLEQISFVVKMKSKIHLRRMSFQSFQMSTLFEQWGL